MTDNTELKRLAEAAPGGPWVSENDSLYFKDGGYTRHLLDADAGHDVEPDAYYAALKFIAAANPAAVLALIAENEALKGPHDWLAEDLIKELVDNAQSFQENSDHGDNDPFAIVLLAAASRIRRQEASVDQLKTESKRLAPFEEAYVTACNVRNRLIKDNELLDRLIVENKVISDSFQAERDQLKAENERLFKLLERTVEQYVPLTELEGVPGWSRVVELVEVVVERDQLRAEVAGLKTGYEAYERVNAELKAEVEKLRKERDARHPFKPFHEPSIGFTGCVICGMYTDHGGLPCQKTRATADAALGQGER